ncbi:hypothetical protein Tco_0946351 [Tanacetum coccineum]
MVKTKGKQRLKDKEAQKMWVFALDPLTELAQHVTSKNDMLAILRCPQCDPTAIKLDQKIEMIGWQRLKEVERDSRG